MRKFTADDIRKLHEKCLFILRAAKRTDVASCQLLRQPLVDYRLTAGFDDLRPPTHTHTHTHNAIQLNSTQRVDQHSSVSVAAGNQACNFESISENHQSFVGKYIIKCQSHKRTLIARGHACAIFITPPTHAPPRSSHLGIDIDCTLRSYIDLFTISVYKAPRCFNSL